MGNINFRDESWFINNTDKIVHEDEIEIKQEDGTWMKVIVEKGHGGVFHFSPSGFVLTSEMKVRRVITN